MRRAVVVVLGLGACSSPTTPIQTAGDVTVAITSPSGGTELVGSEAPTITVTGSITTTNPNVGVLVGSLNGTALELDGSGNFTIDIAPQIGVNHIVVSGSDGFGTVVDQQLDVLWAPDYLAPTAGTTNFELPGALDLYLGQGFFDVRQLGTTLDLTTDPVIAHDLASALELILWNIDLATLIDGGIHVGSGDVSLDLTIGSATPAEIIVDTAVVSAPGAIDLGIDLNGVFLATTGTFHNSGTDLVVAGGIAADMHAQARIELAIAPEGGISVSVSNVTAVVGPLSPQFTGPNADQLDGFITVGNSSFRTLVTSLIQQQLIPTFTDKIPPLLETLLGATDKLLDDVSLTLDAQLGTPVTIALDGSIGGLDIVAGPAVGSAPGHVTVHQGVNVSTTSTPIHGSSHGALRTTSTPEAPTASTAGLQIFLQQDFLNALLHSLWNGGVLDGVASFGGLSANVSAKLPPVVVPTPDEAICDIDGQRCDLLIQIGQLEMTLPDFGESFVISATAGARVVVAGDTISILVQQTPALTVWQTSSGDGRLDEASVRDVVANVVWPMLFGAIGDKLHLTLPIPDLAALGLDQLSPKLANAKLELAIRQHATVGTGYLGLGADLQLQTPKP